MNQDELRQKATMKKRQTETKANRQTDTQTIYLLKCLFHGKHTDRDKDEHIIRQTKSPSLAATKFIP